jgi:hypothetical protein
MPVGSQLQRFYVAQMKFPIRAGVTDFPIPEKLVVVPKILRPHDRYLSAKELDGNRIRGMTAGSKRVVSMLSTPVVRTWSQTQNGVARIIAGSAASPLSGVSTLPG